MNTCQQVRGQLGEYLDNELAPSARAQVQSHLDECAACRAELGQFERATAPLGQFAAAVPEGLWPAIERRLANPLTHSPQRALVNDHAGRHRHADDPRRHADRDGRAENDGPAERDCHAEPATAGKLREASPARIRPLRLRSPARLATAAAIIFAAGLALSSFVSYDRPAVASEIDFCVLLESLPEDANGAFAKFISHNKGQRMTPEQVRKFAPGLTFDTPSELPGGFQLKEVYALRVGENPGVAARYERNGEFLAAIFHPPVKREDFGSHKDYPCVVGKHRGHAVSVGEWKLVHLTDPTTCHCVLSRLDEHTELPAVMRALAVGSTALEE